MSTTSPNALDVRPLPPNRTFPTVLSVFEALDVGESFVLVNDDDPTPLRDRIAAERPGEIQWVSLKNGPHVWYVQITRLQAST